MPKLLIFRMMPAKFVMLVIFLVLEAESLSKYRERIVGGDPTHITKYPFLSGLIINDEHAVCGASIISENWALTAGHCVRYNFSYSIHAGSSYLHAGGSYHEAIEVIRHPEHDPDTHDNDIGLVKVDPTFPIDNITVGIVQLTDEERKVGDCLTTVGWGVPKEDGRMVQQLNYVSVTMVPWDSCNEAYGCNLTARMICAASPGKDACQGDSGGPLLNSEGLQVGIVSFGEGCADPEYPGVYVNLARQRNWIRQVTGI